MVTLDWVIFSLRLLTAGLLYSFLGIALYILWQDLRLTTRRVTRQARRRPRLRVQQTLPELSYRVGDIIPLEAVMVIGSDDDSDMVLPHLAPRHARLLQEQAGWWFEPLATSALLQLNDHPLTTPSQLTSGDTLHLGEFRVIFEA